MKKIAVIILLVVTAWYGQQFYKQGKLPFFQNHIASYNATELTKCITSEGGTFYGQVPKSVVCDRIEAVENTVTIVSKDYFGYTPDKQPEQPPIFPKSSNPTPSKFSCSGKQHCSQMRSCEEATFYQNNCPDTKMDGDRDGIPCERQHC